MPAEDPPAPLKSESTPLVAPLLQQHVKKVIGR